MTDAKTTAGSRISRRTLAKGAAWSVPAVAVTAALPAYAASGKGPRINVYAACKQSGNSCNTPSSPYGFIKGYVFAVSITNSTSRTIYVYTGGTGTYAPRFQVTSPIPFSYGSARLFTPGMPGATGIGAAVGPYIELVPGDTKYIVINAGTNQDSANESAAGTLYFAWGHTATAGEDLDHPYSPLPPNANPPADWGWIGDAFSFGSMPPCSNCAPQGATTGPNVVDPATNQQVPASQEQLATDAETGPTPDAESQSRTARAEPSVAAEPQQDPVTEALANTAE